MQIDSSKNFEKNCSSFASRLRKLRENKGLSQKDLAKKLDFSTNTPVFKYESGQSSPPIDVLNRIAEIFEIDLHWLITGKFLTPKLRRDMIIKLTSDEYSDLVKQYYEAEKIIEKLNSKKDKEGLTQEEEKKLNANIGLTRALLSYQEQLIKERAHILQKIADPTLH